MSGLRWCRSCRRWTHWTRYRGRSLVCWACVRRFAERQPGFSLKLMQAGKRSAAAGRSRPLRDALADLRAHDGYDARELAAGAEAEARRNDGPEEAA